MVTTSTAQAARDGKEAETRIEKLAGQIDVTSDADIAHARCHAAARK